MLLPLRRPPIQVYRSGALSLTFSVEGQGPPLLLVHGLSGSRRWWRYNLRPLTRVRTVYSLELAGFGHARRQAPLGPGASADLIAGWLETLGEPADVIGHSMGGHVSLHLAARHPSTVRRLVLASASGLLKGSWWRLALNLPAAALLGKPGFTAVIATDALRAGLPTLYRATRALLSDDAEPLLPQVTAPTLVVWGGRDVITPPLLGRTLATRIAGARLVLYPRAGHVVMVDAATDFNRDVLAFLTADAPAGGAA